MSTDTWPDGVVYRHMSSCDSTQDEAVRLLAEYPECRAVVVRSDEQTRGRGRHGRQWSATAESGVLLSIGLPQLASQNVQLEALDLRSAHGVADVVRHLFSLDDAAIAIKAPNDLLDAQGAKLAGVLVDVRSVGAAIDRVVIGVGVNLRGVPFIVDGRACTTVQAIAPDVELTHELDERCGRAIASALLRLCLIAD